MNAPPLAGINALRAAAMHALPGWAVDFDGHRVELVASPTHGHPDAGMGIRVLGWPVRVLVARVRRYEARTRKPAEVVDVPGVEAAR